jgi:O-antigen/teichoic acid export membrane protein
MSTTRKIAHNTGIQIAGKVISTALGLLGIGMMTRYLGTEQFGWYITAITFLQFIGILIDFGLIPVTAQMLGEETYEEKTLLDNLLGFRITTAVFFLALAPFIALFFPYPPLVKITIAMSTISFVSIAINQIFMGYFQKKLTMYLHAIAENVGRIVLIVGLYLVMTLDEGFLWVMVAVIASNLAFTTALIIGAARQTKLGLRFDFPIWKAIAIKMWPVATAVIFNVVYLKGDTIILSIFGTQSEVGLYGAAYRVVDILSQLAMMLMGVLLPIMAAAWVTKNIEALKHHVQQGFDAMMLFAVPVTIGVYVLGTPIIVLVAGAEFAGAGIPLTLLSLAIFGVFIGAIFGHIAVAIDKQKETLPIYMTNAVITLIGYMIIIPKYGMTGAALMTIFSEAYTGILLYIKIHTYLPFRIQYRVFIRILAAGTLMGWSIYFLADEVHVLIASVLGALIYAAGILLFRAISKQTLQEIISIKRG